MDIINKWKKKKEIKLYTPYTYFKGFTTQKLVIEKLEEMYKSKHEKDISKIKYKTDKYVPSTTVKSSNYNKTFEKRFSISSRASFDEKAKATGVPKSIIMNVFRRGIAAWNSGHRPGTNPYQWGYSRVNSFLTLGCTAFSGDADLLKKVYNMKGSNEKRKNFLSQRVSCPKSKLDKFKKSKNFPEFIFKNKK